MLICIVDIGREAAGHGRRDRFEKLSHQPHRPDETAGARERARHDAEPACAGTAAIRHEHAAEHDRSFVEDTGQHATRQHLVDEQMIVGTRKRSVFRREMPEKLS